MSALHWSDQRAASSASPTLAETKKTAAHIAAPPGYPVPGLLFGPEAEFSDAQRYTLPDVLRRKAGDATINETGLPDQLKRGLESLSGMDMSAIKVHYNSDRPAGLDALAYAQGAELHIGPGQEAHLPHEAWHVVQQMQGRVHRSSPSDQLVADDGLETEADTMGARAASGTPERGTPLLTASAPQGDVVQRKLVPDEPYETLLDDLGVKKSQKEVATALKKMLTEIRKLAIDIRYADVVEAVRKVGLNPVKIGKIAAHLERDAAAELDEDLSGGRGHMMGRHYAVDAQSQAERAKNENKPKVTRIDKDKGSGHRYMNYVRSLKKKVPEQLRDHVEDIATRLFRRMQEDDWTELNLGNKRNRLTTLLGDLATTIDYPGWEINYVWTVKVTAGGTTLTCAPEIESNRTFGKVETALDGDEAIEIKAMDALNMYWGSNKLVIGGLQPTLTESEFATKLSELEYSKLGVTQF